MRKSTTIAGAVLALALIACGTTASDRSSDRDSRQESGDDLRTEDKLSLMFGGDADRIGAQLDAAAVHCPEGRDRVADYITYSMKELDEKKPGHGENALTLATAIAEVAEVGSGAECSELAATLLVLMLN